MDYNRQSAGNKEEIMKRLIYIAVVLMIGLMVVGCAGMTEEQRKEEPSLSATVGNAPFVGYSSIQSVQQMGAGLHSGDTK